MAIIRLRELFDSFENEISKKDLETFVKLLSPFVPHIAEELWEKIGNKGFISLAEWPKADERKINEEFDKEEQIVEKTVADVLNILKIVRGEKIYIYALPKEVEFYSSELIEKRVGKEVKVFAVNDNKKYDPQGKAGKAKPGKPAIFVE
jgi:leucyl-tRNA synthetase